MEVTHNNIYSFQCVTIKQVSGSFHINTIHSEELRDCPDRFLIREIKPLDAQQEFTRTILPMARLCHKDEMLDVRALKEVKMNHKICKKQTVVISRK